MTKIVFYRFYRFNGIQFGKTRMSDRTTSTILVCNNRNTWKTVQRFGRFQLRSTRDGVHRLVGCVSVINCTSVRIRVRKKLLKTCLIVPLRLFQTHLTFHNVFFPTNVCVFELTPKPLCSTVVSLPIRPASLTFLW